MIKIYKVHIDFFVQSGKNFFGFKFPKFFSHLSEDGVKFFSSAKG